MRTRRFFLSGLLFLATTGLTSRSEAAPAISWSGIYVYEEDGGKTAGGTAIFITHTLRLWSKNGQWQGKLESNGYQTYIDTVVSGCKHGDGDTMDVVFQSRSAETFSPQAKRGDRLFSLVRRGRGQLQTRWGVFWPVSMEKAPPRGRYFRRQSIR